METGRLECGRGSGGIPCVAVKCVDIWEEHQWLRRRSGPQLTLIPESVEQIGLDTLESPRRKPCSWKCRGSNPGAGANAISDPPNSTFARMKRKGIERGLHKRWSMWFNSKQREEPYQVSTLHLKGMETSS